MMKKICFLFLLFFSQVSFALESASSFVIEIQERKISVTSPTEKNINQTLGLEDDPASSKIGVIFENKTLDKIYAEFRKNSETIKRFVLEANQNKTIEIDKKLINGLYFVPVSPPFQGVPLKFSQGKYEIPQKTKEK